MIYTSPPTARCWSPVSQPALAWFLQHETISQHVCKQGVSTQRKKMKIDPYLTPYQNQFQMYVKGKTLRLLEEKYIIFL